MDSFALPMTVKVDGVNISRGADQTIVYTAAYGTTTATNEYGYEVVVENGLITRLGGNDLTIPPDGFVVSFHGAAMSAMRTRVAKGMSVQYDSAAHTVVFDYDAQGLRQSVMHAVEDAQKQIERAKEAFVYADYDAVQAALDELRQEADVLLNKDGGPKHDDCAALINKIDTLCQTLCDSYSVQYRGVWIRPSQDNEEAVEAYVKTLHDARINFVCIEGWFDNGVVMELPEGSLFSRNPRFQYDVLKAYVEACHKYGMECHLWMPILNVGSFHDKRCECTPAGRKPEWMSKSNHGEYENPNGFMMLDPANEEACNYLLDFYRYIVMTYDIDCFEVDYIRYYAASDDADYGYTQAAFDGFEKAYGYGVTPAYDKEAAYWEDWCQYRRDCVTRLVKNIRAMIDREAPHVLLAADVAFPFEHATNSVYQNFPQWLEEGILDVLHPMAYGDGYGNDICKAVALAGDRCMVVTGLGAQGDLLRVEELERQTRENSVYGAYGECYFEADAYFYKHLPPAVMKNAYRREAVSPFYDVKAAVSTALSYMLERIDNVIYPLGGMTVGEVTAVKQAVDNAVCDLQNEAIPLSSFAALHRVIADIRNTQAVKALQKDLYRAEHILCVRHRLPAARFAV